MARGRGTGGGRDVEDDGHLPWLEPAEMDDDAEPIAPRKWIIAGAAVFVVALVGTVAAVYSGKDEDQYGSTVVAGSGGEPPLILAPKEPFRTRPDDPGGLRGEGEGLMIGAVARGQDPAPEVKLATGPEQPVERPLPPQPQPATMPPAGPAGAAAPGATVAPNHGTQAQTAPAGRTTAPAVTAPTTASGILPAPSANTQTAKSQVAKTQDATAAQKQQQPPKLAAAQQPTAPAKPKEEAAKPAEPKKPVYYLQLGAFSSTERAQAGWQQFSQKYEQLKDLNPDIQPIKTGDKTMYRLRAGHISLRVRADSICSKLRAAGQPCIVAEK